MKKKGSLLLTVFMILWLCACGQKNEIKESAPTWQEQYDLGIRYLSEGNYEEAILAFTAAIEIDPKSVDAYTALADAYLGAGDYDKAAEVLQQGREACGDAAEFDRITESLEFLQSGGTGILITDFYFDKTAYLAGASTEFLVSVAYRCPEGQDCILMIGANTDEPHSFLMMDEDFAVSGSGGYQFKVSVTPVQWEDALFGIYVNLSEANHADTWTPFAADTMYIDAEGNLSREQPWVPESDGGYMGPADDPYVMMHNMMQQDGALTIDDVPEIFHTPYNQLGGLLGREYATGSEFTSEHSGSYGITENGEYRNEEYVLPVQYCGYVAEGTDFIQACAPLGSDELLDLSVYGSSGSIGWRGIQMSDTFADVLMKLGMDAEFLQEYYGVDLWICANRQKNSGYFTEEGGWETPLGRAKTIYVAFTDDEQMGGYATWNVSFTFDDGEHLSNVCYHNFGLLRDWTSYGMG